MALQKNILSYLHVAYYFRTFNNLSTKYEFTAWQRQIVSV